MTAKKKTHRFVIEITFNKPIGNALALHEVRDCIYGEFYPLKWEDSDPEEFRVRGFSPLSNKKNPT